MEIQFEKNGNLLLAPGDYLIPVMTYCMRSSGKSPDGHIYLLSQMQGSRARMIRDLNLKALPQFSYKDVQILSWSLQNGLKYSELTEESKEIVDQVFPEYKSELKESILENLEKKWDQYSNKIDGIIPESTNADEVFKTISDIRDFRNQLLRVGNNYEALKQRIIIQKNPERSLRNTPWSQISPNIYARFLTDGHFQDLGQIQVRVISRASRNINSQSESYILDLVSLLGDPNHPEIQALSFSPVYGYAGVWIAPALVETPALAIAVVGAVLAAKAVDWEAFQKLAELLKNVKNTDVQKEIQDGMRVLNERQDKLEEPLREKKIIDRKTPNTTEGKGNSVREYTKSGGNESLEKDFDKFDKLSTKSGEVEYKELDDGTKVVKRPKTENNEKPTLEIQPRPSGHKGNDSIRIKVRY